MYSIYIHLVKCVLLKHTYGMKKITCMICEFIYLYHSFTTLGVYVLYCIILYCIVSATTDTDAAGFVFYQK